MVTLTGHSLTLEEISLVLYKDEKVEIARRACKRRSQPQGSGGYSEKAGLYTGLLLVLGN